MTGGTPGAMAISVGAGEGRGSASFPRSKTGEKSEGVGVPGSEGTVMLSESANEGFGGVRLLGRRPLLTLLEVACFTVTGMVAVAAPLPVMHFRSSSRVV